MGKNYKIVTDYGDFVATLSDIIVDDKFNIMELVLSDKQQEITRICGSVSDIIIIKDKSKMRSKKKVTFPHIDENLKDIPVKKVITRKTGDTNFLIGRIVTQNICGITGEIIIQKHSLVTKVTIQKAKNNYKLAELIQYSKDIL